ncbi:MAG: hypothetical protein HN377_07680 [Alphaproteobacteria bacterium]|jgi:hypothetical protein|nr:hypothetical protein [Alphaproteobacteria bacterium]
MRDRPNGANLLALIGRIEAADPSVSLPGDEVYTQRMLAHAKAIAERQEVLGDAPEQQELQSLRSLLGKDGELADLNRALAMAIRGGNFDPGATGVDAARRHLWQTALDRVRESNPKALKDQT